MPAYLRRWSRRIHGSRVPDGRGFTPLPQSSCRDRSGRRRLTHTYLDAMEHSAGHAPYLHPLRPAYRRATLHPRASSNVLPSAELTVSQQHCVNLPLAARGHPRSRRRRPASTHAGQICRRRPEVSQAHQQSFPIDPVRCGIYIALRRSAARSVATRRRTSGRNTVKSVDR